jgi:poly[(R)-3-hydroxyalkanoate] polymerase subunit PhaC
MTHEPPHILAERAAAAAAGGEVFAEIDPLDVLMGLADILRPGPMARETHRLLTEVMAVAVGTSEITPAGRDARFNDPAWSENPVYKRVCQSYLLWCEAMRRLVEERAGNHKLHERARFAVSILTSALAPSNVLAGNPEALKHAFDTGGRSLLRGGRNFLRDLSVNGGMPAQVDTTPFKVGKNLAATPGAVVHRADMFELIHYAPSTSEVLERSFLMVPPQINKHYFVDLAPGRSFVEWAVGQGVPFFSVVWRNPRPEHGHWSLEDYLRAILEATDIVREITKQDTLNLFGLCAGGASLGLLLSHLTAIGDERVHATMFAISQLDFSEPSAMSLMTNQRLLRRARHRAQAGDVIDKRDMAKTFAWLRPNDLVWNYVVNNWLMGRDPPAFDVLAWNNDPTALPGRLHADFVELFSRNALAEPNGDSILGTPIDLSAVRLDSYVVAGRTDHITPWKPCYSTTQLLGGESRFVLTSTGHIQTIVNPPGKPRARYHSGSAAPADAEAWLARATEQEGSWWPDWRNWIGERSGKLTPAPTKLGSRRYPPRDPAPGQYVLER